MTAALSTVAELASLAWKLSAAFEREVDALPEGRREGAAATLRYARRRLDTLLAADGCRLITYDGDPWSAGLPAAPINAADIDGCDAVVEATIDPTIVHGTDVLLPGRIVLKAI